MILYGASDDLIEIDGDWREEISASGDPGMISTSTGALIEVEYADDGNWKFRCSHTGNNTVEHHPAGSARAKELTGRDYSDAIILTSNDRFTFAAFAEKNAVAKP